MLEYIFLRIFHLDYFLWKDTENVKSIISDNGKKIELDILICEKSLNELLSILKEMNFILYKNRIPNYKVEVYHAFKFSEVGYTHFHIYPKLITGNHYAKEFLFPNFFEFNECYSYFGLKIANKSVESLLASIRVAAKSKSKLFSGIKDSDLKNVNQESLSKINELMPLGIEQYRYKSKIQVVFDILYFKYIYRLSCKMLNTSNKTILEKRKIAFIGTDGSGKSTICESVYKHIRKKTPVKHVYLGSNFKTFSIKTWAYYFLYKSFYRFFKFTPCKNIYSNGLFNYEFSRLQDTKLKYEKALSDIEKGYFVIFERFPLSGFLDFPKNLELDKISQLSNNNVNKKAELNSFWSKAASDIKFILITTPLDTILERRKISSIEMLDIKKKKNIEKCFLENEFFGHKVRCIVNDGPLEETLKEVYEEI